MSILLTIIGIASIIYLVAILTVYLRQPDYIYLPSSELTTTPEQHGYDYENIELLTSDGIKLHGWFVPCEGATQVLLFFHGNRGNISDRIETIAMAQQLGLSIFLFDYRGYGLSAGSPDEQGTYLDALSAWHYLIERGYTPKNIIILGRSLGAAIASWLASQHTPGALIIESTFTSVPDIAAEHFPYLPVRWISRYQYNVRQNLQAVYCPVMVIHSPHDEVIPFAHGEALFKAIINSSDKQFLEICGNHYAGYLDAGDHYINALIKFTGKIN